MMTIFHVVSFFKQKYTKDVQFKKNKAIFMFKIKSMVVTLSSRIHTFLKNKSVHLVTLEPPTNHFFTKILKK